MSEDKAKPTLSEMIEKIIDNGNLSAQDQNEINMKARGLVGGEKDYEAVERLMRLIKEGRINVS